MFYIFEYTWPWNSYDFFYVTFSPHLIEAIEKEPNTSLASYLIPKVVAFSRLGEVAVRALFCLVVVIAIKLFGELGKRMDRLSAISSDQHDADAELLSTELDNWLHHYDLICQLVDHINECFGFILAIMLIHTVFMTSILYCYRWAIIGPITIFPLVAVHHISRLLVLFIVGYKMKKKVSRVHFSIL